METGRRRESELTDRSNKKSFGSKVRTSAADSRCIRNRQPRASDAHTCVALCGRQCRRNTEKEQQFAADIQTDAGGSVHNTASRRTSFCNLRAHNFGNCRNTKPE